MTKPLDVSQRSEDYERIQNMICSNRFLEALIAHHGPVEEPKPIPKPVMLPPIPNELIAAAHDAEPVISVRNIQNFVCKEFNISLNDMLSQRRKKNIVIPRQVATFLCKKLTRLSLPAIGRRFFRDHTTQISSIRRIEQMMANDPAFADRINKLEERLGGNLA